MNTKVYALIIVSVMICGGAVAVFALNTCSKDPRAVLDEELQVYGNANGDWKVNEDDAAFLSDIIQGKRERTKYADANKDGIIDQRDMDQVRSLADGSAESVWLVDGNGVDRRIKRDIERIGCEYYSNTELMLILGMKDKVYAVDNAPFQIKDFYFGEGSPVKNMVNMNVPDYEMIETMDLDILLTFSFSGSEAKQEKLPAVDVIYLGMYRPNVQEPTKSEYFQGILKAGYIFGAVDRAESYMNWLLDIRDTIHDRTKGIAEGGKPKVLMTNYTNSYFQTGVETTTWSVYTSIDPMEQACVLAGGHSVSKSILSQEQYAGGSDRTLYAVKVGPEKIISKEIDYAFCHCVKFTFGGTVTDGPNHGYGTSDSTEMEAAYNTAKGRTLVDIPNIHIDAGDFRNGASGCLLLALYMAKVLHPELFIGVDPLTYHQSYVSDWMGIRDYDIREKGVFMVPYAG